MIPSAYPELGVVPLNGVATALRSNQLRRMVVPLPVKGKPVGMMPVSGRGEPPHLLSYRMDGLMIIVKALEGNKVYT